MGEPATPSAAVLIVEDEPLIRMGTVYLIEDAGFEVYEAGSADAAIAPARTARGNPSYRDGCRHAGLDGWAEARPLCSRTMAPGKNHCYFGARKGDRRKLALWRTLHTKTV